MPTPHEIKILASLLAEIAGTTFRICVTKVETRATIPVKLPRSIRNDVSGSAAGSTVCANEASVVIRHRQKNKIIRFILLCFMGVAFGILRHGYSFNICFRLFPSRL